MSLGICIRSIKDGDRELCIYQSGGKYKIRYENQNQNTTFKSGIIDIGYVNYLFDMYAKDLHMQEILIDEEDICDINSFKEKMNKHQISLIKNRGVNNRSRVNRRSSDIYSLIKLQSEIIDIIMEDYGEFEIIDKTIDEFIENQKYMRKVLCESDYSTTSYGSKLNRYFKSIDRLNSDKFKVWKDKELVKLFDIEIERVEDNLRNAVRELLNCNES